MKTVTTHTMFTTLTGETLGHELKGNEGFGLAWDEPELAPSDPPPSKGPYR